MTNHGWVCRHMYLFIYIWKMCRIAIDQLTSAHLKLEDTISYHGFIVVQRESGDEAVCMYDHHDIIYYVPLHS